MNVSEVVPRMRHACGRFQREIGSACGLSVGAVNGLLRSAELAGLVRPLPAGRDADGHVPGNVVRVECRGRGWLRRRSTEALTWPYMGGRRPRPWGSWAERRQRAARRSQGGAPSDRDRHGQRQAQSGRSVSKRRSFPCASRTTPTKRSRRDRFHGA